MTASSQTVEPTEDRGPAQPPEDCEQVPSRDGSDSEESDTAECKISATGQGELELRAEADSIEHPMIHLPKKPYCQFCQKAKLNKKPVHSKRAREGSQLPTAGIVRSHDLPGD